MEQTPSPSQEPTETPTESSSPARKKAPARRKAKTKKKTPVGFGNPGNPRYQRWPGPESDGTAGISFSTNKWKNLPLIPGTDYGRVLFLGCAEGFHVCHFQRGHIFESCLGIDRDEKAIEVANEKIRSPVYRNTHDPELRAEIQHVNWWDVLTPCPQSPSGHRFDTIFALAAIEHDNHPDLFLRAIAANLAPDGMLVLECGVTPSWTDRPSQNKGFTQSYNYNWPTISRWLDDAGLNPSLYSECQGDLGGKDGRQSDARRWIKRCIFLCTK